MPTFCIGGWGFFCLVWRKMVFALRKLQVLEEEKAGTQRTHANQAAHGEMWAHEPWAHTQSKILDCRHQLSAGILR